MTGLDGDPYGCDGTCCLAQGFCLYGGMDDDAQPEAHVVILDGDDVSGGAR